MSSLLLDMSPLRYPHTGLGQFCFYLGKHILPLLSEDIKVDFLGLLSSKKLFEEPLGHWENLYWIRRHSPQFMHKYLYKKYDFWHATAQNTQILPPHKETKLLLTIHDLNFLQDDVGRKQKKLQALQQKVNRASGIAFISEFTQKDAQKHLDLGNIPQKIIHNGVEIKMFDNPKQPIYLNANDTIIFGETIQKPFLFSIGTLFPRKNFAVLLPFLAQIPDYQLVIAGKNDTEYAGHIRQEIQRLNLSDRVILTGEVSDEDKYWLYKNCEGFLFPSILEGFGLPVIEAMLVGKPVFTTQYTSLPEVGGQRAFYWNDFSPEKMKTVFENGMNIAKTEENFAQNQINHAQKFTWEIASKNYWDFYQEFL